MRNDPPPRPLPPRPGKMWGWAISAALATVAIVAIVATGIVRDSRFSTQLDTDLQALDAAGTNLDKLRIFAEQCRARPSCTLSPDANNRIRLAGEQQTSARTDTDRLALEAAGNDIFKLRSFVDQCKASSCALETISRGSLERAETTELESALFDVTRLQACAQLCRTSSVKAQAEAKLGLIQGEENAYRLARNNAGLLQKYAIDCKACKFKTAAVAEAAELTKPKSPLGFNTTVGYDMNGGDIDSPDFLIRDIDAPACLAKCQATNSCIAYSFDKWIKTCYLKNKLVSLTLDPRSDTNIRKDQLFPGLLNSPKQFCRYSSVAIIGDGSPGVFSPTAKVCEQSCEIDQTCAAYVFRATDKQCRLLRNTVDRQKGSGLDNITSGVKTQIKCN